MIFVCLAVSVLASCALLLYLRGSSVDESRHLLARGFLELTIPISIAAAVFAILQVWVRFIASSVNAVTTIREIERAIRTIRNTYVESLKIPPIAQFAIVIGLLVAGVVWPQVRAGGLLEGFKSLTKWLTRTQIVATLLASLTFFGSVHVTDARSAEARLARNITEIEREYDAAFASAEKAVAAYAAGALVEQPAWSGPLAAAADAIENDRQAAREASKAREQIAREPHSEFRDFRLSFEREPAPAPRETVRRHHSRGREERASWSRAEGERRHREADALLAEVTTEAVHATVELSRSFAAEHAVKAFLSGGTAEGVAEAALDPSVIYDFRHVVAQMTVALVQRIARNESVREAFAAVQANIRAAVSRIAAPMAKRAAPIYSARAAEARARRETAANALREYRARADAQAEREEVALMADVRRYTSKSVLAGEAMQVVRRIIDGPRQPAMARIARIRNASSAFRVKSPAEAFTNLSALELRMGGETPFTRALDAEAESIMENEHESRWGYVRSRMHEAYRRGAVGEPHPAETLVMLNRWDLAKRHYALTEMSLGRTITPSQWERIFYLYCTENTDMAAIWGFFVVTCCGDAIAERYDLDAVKPRHGYRYYLEETGFAGQAQVEATFSTPLANETIERHCPH